MDPIKKVSKARRRMERKKMRNLKNKPIPKMASTFTAGFHAKEGDVLDKFELGDVMEDGAESHPDAEEDEED